MVQTIEEKRAKQRTEEYKIKKRLRDKKYRELKVFKPREKLSPEEAKNRLKERKKKQKKAKFERNNDWINRYKRLMGCISCGYKEHSEILHFHHKRGNKDFNISKRKDKSLETLKKEIEKCILLCPNCHMWLHHQEKHNKIKGY